MQHAALTHAAGTAKQIAALKAGHHVELWNINLRITGAVNVTIEDTDGTDLMGLLTFAAAGNWNPDGNGNPLCRTATGVGLQMLLSGAVLVAGSVSWEYVRDDP